VLAKHCLGQTLCWPINVFAKHCVCQTLYLPNIALARWFSIKSDGAKKSSFLFLSVCQGRCLLGNRIFSRPKTTKIALIPPIYFNSTHTHTHTNTHTLSLSLSRGLSRTHTHTHTLTHTHLHTVRVVSQHAGVHTDRQTDRQIN
jgi:hypothetical protein